MVRHNEFDISDRVALWEGYNRKCFYCSEPLHFNDLEIDHIIPLSIAESMNIQKLRDEYHLSPNFDINNFYNLVPAHRKCNRLKSDLIFNKSRIMYFLGIAESKADRIAQLATHNRNKLINDKMIANLTIAVARGDITHADLIKVFYHDKTELIKPLQNTKLLDRSFLNLVQSSTKDEMMKLPVFPDAFGDYRLSLINAKDDRVYIETCEEYENALSKGYSAFGNYNIRRSYIFDLQLAVINALFAVRAPEISFISNSGVGLVSLAILPSDILLNYGDGPDLIADKDTSVQKLIDEKQVEIKEVSHYHICLETEYNGWLLWEVMRGDLNDDYYEEILVYRYSYLKKATLRVGDLLLLKRKDKNSFFEISDYKYMAD
jgi:hypothetical protein